MTLLKELFRHGILFFLLTPFLSCGGESSGNGNFRFVQLSPNAPALNVLIDNEDNLTGVDFLENSGFIDGPGEEFNLKLTPTDSENPMVTSFVNSNFNAIDGFRTLISTGFYGSTPPAAIITVDTDRIPADANQVRLKWIHAAPNLHTVTFDIYVLSENNNCSDLNGQFPISENLFYTDSSSDYRTLDSGVYDICVVPKSGNSNRIFIDNYNFQSRMKLTIIIYQDPETFRPGLYILDDVTGDEDIVFL